MCVPCSRLIRLSPRRTAQLSWIRLEGSLDLERLRYALEQVIARHEILRTSFPLLPGLSLPVQVIDPSARLTWIVQDLSTLSADEQDEILPSLSEQARQQPKDIHTEVELCVMVLKLRADVHLMLLDMSILNGDVQTCQLFLQEVSQYYAADVSSDDEPLQYADLAEWQYELLTSAETGTGRAYWRALESQTPTTVPLPYELSFPTVWSLCARDPPGLLIISSGCAANASGATMGGLT